MKFESKPSLVRFMAGASVVAMGASAPLAFAQDATADEEAAEQVVQGDDNVIIGIHAVGAHVAELSGEFAHALEMGARLEDIAGTIHVHPTLTEAFAEAALAGLGHAIHVAK